MSKVDTAEYLSLSMTLEECEQMYEDMEADAQYRILIDLEDSIDEGELAWQRATVARIVAPYKNILKDLI